MGIVWDLFFGEETTNAISTEQEIENLQKVVDQETNAMTNTYCPINGDECFCGCVHFAPGKVVASNEYVRHIAPGCRLWSR